MSDHLARLYRKLCRELSQAERSADLHPGREARRLGGAPPAEAFRAISQHARSVWPAFESAMGPTRKLDRWAGELVGRVFSISRQLVIDRVTDAHRSYRGTLLGLQHGVDCARLLAHVSARMGNAPMLEWCESMVAARVLLIERAEAELAWFAAHPQRALA